MTKRKRHLAIPQTSSDSPPPLSGTQQKSIALAIEAQVEQEYEAGRFGGWAGKRSRETGTVYSSLPRLVGGESRHDIKQEQSIDEGDYTPAEVSSKRFMQANANEDWMAQSTANVKAEKNFEREVVPRRSADDSYVDQEITDEERVYFIAIKGDLEEEVQRMQNGLVLSPTATEEGETEGFQLLWERIAGREIALCKDKQLSFVVENLLRLTGIPGVSHIMSILVRASKKQSDLLDQLCCHYCASHVLETIFESIVPAEADRDAVFRKAFRRFIRSMLVNPGLFFENNYAAHVMEKMLLRSCRITGYKLDEGAITYTIYDRTLQSDITLDFTKDDTKYRRFADSVRQIGAFVDEKSIGDILEVLGNYLVPAEADGPSIDVLFRTSTTTAGSVVVQALIASLNILQISTGVATGAGGTLLPVLVSQDPDQPRKEARDISVAQSTVLLHKLAYLFPRIVCDKYGSRVAEHLVASAFPDVFDEVLNSVLEEEFLVQLIQDQSGHHGIIKLITFCSDVNQLLRITEGVSSRIDLVLKQGRGLILVKLFQKLADDEQKQAACGRQGSAAEWNRCQHLMMSGLRDVYDENRPDGWTDVEVKDSFGLLVGALYPRNFNNEIMATAKAVCMAGSQVLQALCYFKDCSIITNSFLKMSGPVLSEFCSNPYGSHVTESLLRTQRNIKGFYHPFVKKMTQNATHFVLTKYGSRVFDYLWKSVEMKHREAIMEELLPVESRMKTNDFGRYILPKVNFGLYRRSTEAWLKEQERFQCQKDNLKEILDMVQKKGSKR